MTGTLDSRYQADIQSIREALNSIGALRTDPPQLQEGLPVSPEEWETFMHETDVARHEMVRLAHRRRVEYLASRNEPIATIAKQRLDGRFLAFDPDASLSDGAAMVATSGFYTFDNAPPSILWLDYVLAPSRRASPWTPFSAYLLSWIPDELVALATKGIGVNAEGCLRWVS